MKLYKILVINILTWGIPIVITYFVYEISQKYVLNGNDFSNQMLGLFLIFVAVLFANYSIFWDKYYNKYLSFDDERPKANKSEKEKML